MISGTPKWRFWEPSITAYTGGTNPTLGTGAVRWGMWTEEDGYVFGQVWIKFGSSGVSAGSGYYLIDLPKLPHRSLEVLSDGGGLSIGSGYIQDSSLFNVRTCWIYYWNWNMEQTPYAWMVYDGTATYVQGAVPTTWAAGDEIGLTFRYRVA